MPIYANKNVLISVDEETQDGCHDVLTLSGIVDGFERKSHRERAIVGALIGHSGTLVGVGIDHSCKGIAHGREDVGRAHGIALGIEGGRYFYCAVHAIGSQQTACTAMLVGKLVFQDALGEVGFAGTLHVGTYIAAADQYVAA